MFNEIIDRVTESATSPSSSVPIVGAIGIGNWFSVLPEVINVLTILYITLLICHKGFVLYKDWRYRKTDKEVVDE